MAGADGEAAASSPGDLAQIINENSHSKQDILGVDKTTLYWKKMPSQTWIAREASA